MTNEQEEALKELGLKVGTPEQEIWEDVKRKTKLTIEQYEQALVINREILKLAEEKTKDILKA